MVVEPVSDNARLIETWFPSVELSRLVAADRRLRDPVYGLHRWFARRPPTLVRGLLLAAALDSSASRDEFWKAHATPGTWLNGHQAYDPFMGGGTSLVEAARMGASVAGRDVDPVATDVVTAQLTPSASVIAIEVAEALVAELAKSLALLMSADDESWLPLHWFWLRKPVCPHCDEAGLLYKDLIVARSDRRTGSVVRADELHAFCPECLAVHGLKGTRLTLKCCNRQRRLSEGTYAGQRWTCPSCGERSSHEQLRTGIAERVLLAVEETSSEDLPRRIRAATSEDRERVVQAAAAVSLIQPPNVGAFDASRRDQRPLSLGFAGPRDMFSDRQWLLFSRAFELLDADDSLSESVRRAVRLVLTGCLTSNNLLCGYARDYGRLAPLFSVRGYALPALSVELNPSHPTAGRGTLASGLTRLRRASGSSVQRHAMFQGRPVRLNLELSVQPAAIDTICTSADDPGPQSQVRATVCVTDPPYFDYIAYSELSEFYRVWMTQGELGGTPLLPGDHDPVATFAASLASCLKVTLTRLTPGTPVVFTYHSPHADAWQAIGEALDQAGMRITALWPVLADPHMGHHASAGNCEWDVVVVCRPKADCGAGPLEASADSWVKELNSGGLKPGATDRACFDQALEMALGRSARAGTGRVSSSKRQGAAAPCHGVTSDSALRGMRGSG